MEFPYFDLEFDKISLTINEVRRLLISRDSRNKMIAVKTILKIIKCSTNPERLIQHLINADIIELLCEASCTMDLILLQLIFKCILKFINSKQFFEQQHSTITFEYLLRTLYVLMKIDEKKETFIYGLQLICILIYRLKEFSMSLNDVCNISNIINLLKQVFACDSCSPVICASIEVILNILLSKDVKSSKEILLEITYEALDPLLNILKRDQCKYHITVAAELVNNSMRFLLQSDQTNGLSNLSRDLLLKLNVILKDILVPVLMGTNVLHDDIELVTVILNCILSTFSPNKEVTLEFSEFLVSKGILSFLPQLEYQYLTADLTVIIRSILYELLICLSQHHLGEEKWKFYLSPGLEILPLGSSYHQIFLNGSDLLDPLASIVYNYFYLVTFANPTVDKHFLQNICKFIMLLSEKPSNSILKAIWFVFAVAYLCGSEDCPQSKVPMIKLIQYLIPSDTKLIYTHHPAILYWTFCDNIIPQELQAQIVILWINQDDSESISELHSVIESNRDSCLLIMEVMTLCESKISYKIQMLVSSILREHEFIREDVYKHAWSMLPSCLAKYSSNPEEFHYESIANLVKVCCDFNPLNLDHTLAIRISCVFPGAFSKYFVFAYRSHAKETLILNDQEVNTVVNSLNLASILLAVGNNSPDKRVVLPLLGHEEFLTCIEFFLHTTNEKVIEAVMNLLTFFVLNQKKSKNQSPKLINLEGMKILKFLQGGTKLCITTLKFLTCYLETIIEKSGPLMVYIPQPTALQLRALYLHIHMICSKADENTASCCWSCLRRLLKLSESMGLQEHLAMLPFTSTLLLKTNHSEAWGEAVKFLSVWLELLPIYHPRSLITPKALQVVQHFCSKIDKSKLGPDLINSLNKTSLLEKPNNPYVEEQEQERP